MESKCKLLAVSLLNQMGVKFRRRGSLCSDGQNCIYAELLDIEERKVVDLEEKAEDLREKVEDLKEKLKRSVEELAAVKQRHVDFVSEVRSVALNTRRFRKKALKVFTYTNLSKKYKTIWPGPRIVASRHLRCWAGLD